MYSQSDFDKAFEAASKRASIKEEATSMASALYALYESFIHAGFNEDQAFDLVKGIIAKTF